MPPFEPALEEDLSDANLARLLAADARSASQKYSTQGLSALLGGRSHAAPKVKPNTRFLQNLVKNADTHNDRLKRKEDAERREKLRRLDEQEEERRRDERTERTKRRETQGVGDGPERKRRRLREDDGHGGQGSTKHQPRGRDREKRHRRRRRRNTSSGSSRSHSPARSTSRDRVRDRHHDSHRKRRSRREEHDSRPEDGHGERRTHRKHTRQRSSSPLAPPADDESDEDPSKRKLSEAEGDEPTSDDPLDALVKSKPSSPRRNRSKMDTLFSAEYDPKTDARLNSDEDSDWDRALNAMRDRANFQRTQASRLLAAGFSEEQVKKWESQPSKADGEGSRDVRDVKWKAKGEEREWDRGKPLLGEDVTFPDDENGADVNGKLSPTRQDRKDGASQGWKKSGGLLKGFKNALGS